MPARLSVQIVSLNSEAELGRTFAFIRNSGFDDYELLVFDNGSGDGSVALIARELDWHRQQGRRVWFGQSGRNLGFCAPNNRLLEAGEAPWVLFLNADARPEPGALGRLMDAVQGESVAAMFAPKILLADPAGLKSSGRIDAFGLGLFPDGLNRGAGCGQQDSGQVDREPDAFCPSGAAGLYRREALLDVGGLAESYFAYGDDFDLGMRLRRAGHSCRRIPGSRFIHAGAHVLGAASPERFYLIERNRLYNLLRHYPQHYIRRSPVELGRRLGSGIAAFVTNRGRTVQSAMRSGALPLASAMFRAHRDVWKRRNSLWAERLELERRWPIDEGRFGGWLRMFGLEPEEAFR